MDGLKSPKTGKERSVPLLASLRGPLLELARRNPAGIGPATFVFWSTDRPDRPMDFHFLLHGLKDALVAMLLTEEVGRSRKRLKRLGAGGRAGRSCFTRGATTTRRAWRIAWSPGR